MPEHMPDQSSESIKQDDQREDVEWEMMCAWRGAPMTMRAVTRKPRSHQSVAGSPEMFH